MQSQLYGLEDRDTKHRGKLLPVKDIYLAYKMIDNNLLEYLVYITNDRDYPDKKVWMFEQTVDTQDIFNNYYMEKEIKNNKKWRNLK
ncbi:MAG: hypothetical protein PHF63_06920 [Herbinix sp.]|nr:hypothetical protein [Herbinix sp.]